MPAVSKAQARFFRWAEHNPGQAKKEGVNVTHQQAHDFAVTKDAGLPERKTKKFAHRKKSS